MRALPYSYRNTQAPDWTLLQFDVAGDCGGSWWLLRKPEKWHLLNSPSGNPTARVIIPQEIAWRIFTKGIVRASAAAQTIVKGDLDLGLHLLNMIAIVG